MQSDQQLCYSLIERYHLSYDVAYGSEIMPCIKIDNLTTSGLKIFGKHYEITL